ncbi:MAG: heparin-binding hemagglutinin, partial [Candidatus Sericytochromatia bacterium]|nr:heparin-binding hemagglutinin [Candidatus Tanganyikabacteria bacterium]
MAAIDKSAKRTAPLKNPAKPAFNASGTAAAPAKASGLKTPAA